MDEKNPYINVFKFVKYPVYSKNHYPMHPYYRKIISQLSLKFSVLYISWHIVNKLSFELFAVIGASE
jgi:hypothetical protein